MHVCLETQDGFVGYVNAFEGANKFSQREKEMDGRMLSEVNAYWWVITSVSIFVFLVGCLPILILCFQYNCFNSIRSILATASKAPVCEVPHSVNTTQAARSDRLKKGVSRTEYFRP